jgi:hypothetical protein
MTFLRKREFNLQPESPAITSNFEYQFSPTNSINCQILSMTEPAILNPSCSFTFSNQTAPTAPILAGPTVRASANIMNHITPTGSTSPEKRDKFIADRYTNSWPGNSRTWEKASLYCLYQNATRNPHQ